MSQRELAEVRSLFGRLAVEDAVARKAELDKWRWHNARAVAEASAGLSSVIQSPHDAVAFVAGLDPQVRAALIVAILE